MAIYLWDNGGFKPLVVNDKIAVHEDCCCVEDCVYCDSGTTPLTFLVTLGGAAGTGYCTDCDWVNGAWVLPVSGSPLNCNWKYYSPFVIPCPCDLDCFIRIDFSIQAGGLFGLVAVAGDVANIHNITAHFRGALPELPIDCENIDAELAFTHCSNNDCAPLGCVCYCNFNNLTFHVESL